MRVNFSTKIADQDVRFEIELSEKESIFFATHQNEIMTDFVESMKTATEVKDIIVDTIEDVCHNDIERVGEAFLAAGKLITKYKHSLNRLRRQNLPDEEYFREIEKGREHHKCSCNKKCKR